MRDNYKPLSIKLAWNLAAPRSWVAAICPAIFGILFCSVQRYPLSWWKAILLLLACILLQSSVNTLNDYMDFIKGTDDEEDHLEEKDAVLIYGGIDPKSAMKLGIGYLLAGIALGVIASLHAGYYPLLIGVAGVVVIALYSCGPCPISYLPVGELISGSVMGGLIPLGVCACADGKLHLEVLPAALPLILGIAMIMLCNNSCDIEKDMEAGRRTFPVVVGREKAHTAYRILLLLWMILLVTEPLFLLGKAGIFSLILGFLLAREPFARLFTLYLKPETRIIQMKTIAAANLTGNGAYCLTFFLALIVRAGHLL